MRLFLAAAALLLAALPAAAADVHVSPGPGTPLQDAIDAASDGDILYVGKGTYRENLVITGRSSLQIVGVGRVTVDGGFEGAAPDLVTVTGSTSIRFGEIRFRRATGDGLRIEDCTGVTAIFCTFQDIGGDGVEDVGSAGVSVDWCSLLRCGRGVVLSEDGVEGTSAISVWSTTFRRIEGAGILFAGHDATVGRNRMAGIGGNAIEVDTTGDWTGADISENRISGAKGTAILVTGGGHEVEENTVRGCQTGLLMVGDGGNAVRLNDIRGSKVSGIVLGSIDNVFTDNVCVGSGFLDMECLPLEEMNTFEGNTFRKEEYGVGV